MGEEEGREGLPSNVFPSSPVLWGGTMQAMHTYSKYRYIHYIMCKLISIAKEKCHEILVCTDSIKT